MKIGRWFVWLSLLLSFGILSPASMQDGSTLTVEEQWQFGRGVIEDFNWHNEKLVFPATGKLWQVDPVSNQITSETTADFFPLLTSPEGSRIVTEGRSEMIVRDAQTGDIISRIPRVYVQSRPAWQPDSNILTTLGSEEVNPSEYRFFIELWDTDSGELSTITVGDYVDWIRDLKWQPGGNLLAIQFFSANTILIKDMDHPEQPEHELTTGFFFAWSPDGRKLAVAANLASTVTLWHTDTFEPIEVENPPYFAVTMAWNSDNTRLAGALPDSGVGVWNTNSGEFISYGVEAEVHSDRMVTQIMWQGDLLAALDRTQRLRVWDVSTGALIWDSTDHRFYDRAQGLSVTQNGEFIALVQRKGNEINIIDGSSGTLLQTLQTPSPTDVSDAVWSPSGDTLALEGRDILLWQFDQHRTPSLVRVDDAIYPEVSWSPDGVLAMTPHEPLEGTLNFVDGVTGEALSEIEQILGLMDVRWSPDGRYLALYVYYYNPPEEDPSGPRYQLYIRDMQDNTTTLITFSETNEYMVWPYQDFEWFPDSSGLIGYTVNGSLWRWSIDHKIEFLLPSLDRDLINSPPTFPFPISINQRGDLLAVSNVGTNYDIHILDAQTGSILYEFDALASGSFFFEWTADDVLIVYDGILHAYQVSRNDP